MSGEADDRLQLLGAFRGRLSGDVYTVVTRDRQLTMCFCGCDRPLHTPEGGQILPVSVSQGNANPEKFERIVPTSITVADTIHNSETTSMTS